MKNNQIAEVKISEFACAIPVPSLKMMEPGNDMKCVSIATQKEQGVSTPSVDGADGNLRSSKK